MKIAILTFICTYNPGTTLQAFALKYAIESLDKNVSCNLINHLHKRPGIPLFFKKPSFKTLKGWIFVKYSRKKHLSFINKYCDLSPTNPIFKESLSDFSKDYDKIIVGSDQVWNPQYCEERPMRYLLDFVECDKKKASYASSFGISELPKEYEYEFRKYLNKFSRISVREENTQRILLNQLGIKSTIVLDPTLLLGKKEWEKFITLPKESNYVFLYEVMHRPEAVEFAYNLATEKGLSVIHKNVYDYELKNRAKMWFMSPEEWMGYILKAKYVVTTSFHGTVFSLNFNKQFWVLPRPSTASRVDYILSKYGLEDRKINTTVYCETKDIDYVRVNSLLEQDRKESKDFLNKILTD